MAYIKRRKGSRGEHWDARWDVYVNGKRVGHSKTFDLKKDAAHFLTTIGVKKPSSNDPLSKLTKSFIGNYQEAVDAGQREKSTLRQLKYHIAHHIEADQEFTSLKCGDIGTPEVQAFLDRLYARKDVSPVMVGKVRTTLFQVFSFGARRGFVTSNPVTDTKVAITSRPEAGEDGERFVLPPKDKLNRLLAAAKGYDNTGRAEAFVVSGMFVGLRCSEIRGLPKRRLFLDSTQPKVKIEQKADENNEIGRVKAEKSRREVPFGPDTAKVFQRWLEAAPDSDLVFPNEDGKVWSYSNLWNRLWVPLMNKAELVTDVDASETVRGVKPRKDRQPKAVRGQVEPDGKLSPLAQKRRAEIEFRKQARARIKAEKAKMKQPEFGPHVLRHVYASFQIERGVQQKDLQVLMGHSTLKVTMDLYGHLWPNEDADKLAASVEKALG